MAPHAIASEVELALVEMRTHAALGELEQAIGPAAHSLRSAIDEGLRELADPRADIAFVGGFSSGKSTLINALLGRTVLPVGRGVVTQRPFWLRAGRADVVGYWRGASFAPTDLGPHTSMTSWLGGEHPPWDDREARHWFGAELAQWPIAPWVTIIDTPGFNSEEPDHLRLTLQALDEAEVVVVTVPPRGLSAHERGFVQDEILPRSRSLAFVLNQMDLVDADDIKELHQRARDHADELFGVVDAPVLTCSARGVRNPESGVEGWDPVLRWLEGFAEASTARAVARKVAVSTKSVVDDVRKSLSKEQEAVDDHLAAIAEEESAWSEQSETVAAFGADAEQLIADLRRHFEDARYRVELETTSWKSSMRDWLEDTDHDISKQSEVESAIKKHARWLERDISTIMEETGSRADESVRQWWSVADRAVRERYAELSFTAGVAALPEAEFRQSRKRMSSTTGLPEEFNVLKGALVGGAGAAGGAFVGTLLFPGVGTAVGAALGGFLGWLLGDEREERVEALTKHTDEYFGRIQDHYDAELVRVKEEFLAGVRRARTNRKRSYQRQLAKLSTALAERRAELEPRRATVESALLAVDEWRARLGALAGTTSVRPGMG